MLSAVCRETMVPALLLVFMVTAGSAVNPLQVVYEWYKLDFTWQDDEAKYEAYTRNMYEAKNVVIQNVKIWGDEAFLTVPRSKKGVPATLVKVPSEPSRSSSASPRLEPFPSWEFQGIGNCANLQNVQAIEVDRDGYLWVADSGTVDEFSEFDDPDTKCPPKLLIFDLEKKALISEYQFPKNFLRSGAIFTDMVLDPRGEKTAYITAVSQVDAVIVIYSNKTKSALRVVAFPRVTPNSVAVNGTEVPLKLNKLSIAISLRRDLLYLSPSWQEMLYSVDIHAMKKGDISIRPVGNLPGLSYAITLDSNQILYYSILEKDAVGLWNTSRKFEEGHKILLQNHAVLQFTSSFSIDRSQNLWVLSNRFQTFLNGEVNLLVPNFRLIKSFTGSESYLYAKPKSSATRVKCSVVLLLLLSVMLTR